MKRAFTLIEMLIVVVVLVTLMSIAFKLSSIGGNEEARIKTITRLQRLENCLSGYNAAFGSYPPVKLHASRDIYLKSDGYGRQDTSGGSSESTLSWENVKTACRAQPLGLECPFPNTANINKRIEELGEYAYSRAQQEEWKNPEKYNFKPINSSMFSSYKDKSTWNEVQLFKFGVMSFILPRYLVMIDCEKDLLDYAQWLDNNSLPCDPFTGQKFSNWASMSTNNNATANTIAKLKAIPSQAVTARWMPNLEKMCSSSLARTLFGVQLTESSSGYGGSLSTGAWHDEDQDGKAHMVGGYNSTSSAYILDRITVDDGWGIEFFYYSLPPYQSYTLWSSGANKKTFPPWMDVGMLTSDSDRTTATTWMSDDIIQMSN